MREKQRLEEYLLRNGFMKGK